MARLKPWGRYPHSGAKGASGAMSCRVVGEALLPVTAALWIALACSPAPGDRETTATGGSGAVVSRGGGSGITAMPGTAGEAGTGSVVSGGTICYRPCVELLENETLIDDFERESHSFATWGTPTPTLEIVPDTERGGQVLHVGTNGPDEKWGSGIVNHLGCTDVHPFTGLLFYAKGTTANKELTVSIERQVASPGSCPAGADYCNKHPLRRIYVESEWREHKIPFDGFVSSSPEMPEFYGEISGISLTFPPDGAVDVYLDDIQFY